MNIYEVTRAAAITGLATQTTPAMAVKVIELIEAMVALSTPLDPIGSPIWTGRAALLMDEAGQEATGLALLMIQNYVQYTNRE
jgi:hypothetical protein